MGIIVNNIHNFAVSGRVQSCLDFKLKRGLLGGPNHVLKLP